MAKFRGIVALATLGVTVCFVIRALSQYPGLLTFGSRSRKSKREKTNVLIIAHGRSGSSFLGQIFNSHKDVFYVYEPLITLQVTTMRDTEFYQRSAMRLLKDIFACSYGQQTEFLAFMSRMYLHRFSSRALTAPYCQNETDVKENQAFVYCKDLEPLVTSISCAHHQHTVVKVLSHRLLSLSVDEFTPLLNSGSKLKIVHLVRDPRAVIASMERVGWTSNQASTNTATSNISLFKALVRNYCLNMLQTVRFALEAEEKLSSGYKLVRYEDLVSNPLQVTKELLAFSGIPMSDSVMAYLFNSTSSRHNGSKRSHEEYATFRNDVLLLIDSWRKRLSAKALRVVESHCWPVLEILQYTPVFSQTLLNLTGEK